MTDYKHLTVPEEFADKIRDHDGRNDEERIRNWAEDKISYKDVISYDKEADTLYIGLEPDENKTKITHREDDILVRENEDGDIIGLIIIGFKERADVDSNKNSITYDELVEAGKDALRDAAVDAHGDIIVE